MAGEADDLIAIPRSLLRSYVGAVKDFALSGGAAPQLVPFDLEGQQRTFAMGEQDWKDFQEYRKKKPKRVTKSDTPTAAGIAVISKETGRVLMLQRAPAKDREDDDDHAGEFEFPGGRLEDDESAWDAAKREWEEEVGVKLPSGKQVGDWKSKDGAYQGFAWLIKDEGEIDLRDRTAIPDPDDPSGDEQDSIAWFDPAHLPDLEALRPEVKESTDWKLLQSFRHPKALKELDQLRNYCRHGKRVEKFILEWLPESVHADLRRDGTSYASFKALQEQLVSTKVVVAARASRRSRQREEDLRPLLTHVATQLGELVRRRRSDAHVDSTLHLIDGGRKVLRDAYTQSWLAGRSAATVTKQADDGEDDVPDDAQQDIDSRAQDQEGFLQGLTQDIHGADPPSDAELGARFDMYARTLIPLYESGFRTGITSALTPDDADEESGGVMATWMVTSGDPCELCEAKNGQVWPAEHAPLPGDGGFGEVCMGGMHCRCVLEYEWIPAAEGPSTTALEAGYAASAKPRLVGVS